MKSGIYSDNFYLKAIQEGMISSDQSEITQQIQPNSIDLSISDKVYRVQSSFFPNNDTVMDKVNDLKMYEMEIKDSVVLERNNIYIIPLNESIDLPEFIKGKTNPKSTTGRLDIFTRVVTDHCHAFDQIPYGYSGKLYLEIMPRSFTIRIYKNQTFTQLRLSKGEATLTDKELEIYYKKSPLLFDENDKPIPFSDNIIKDGLTMSLSIDQSANNIGFKAKRNSQIIDLKKLNHYSIHDFWELIPPGRKIILEPEEFYIFRSKEKIKIPEDMCGDMNAYDVSLGELRSHYAGFFDSGFGINNGANIVMEVRSHDIPFLVEDGQKMYSVLFEKNLETPNKLYGSEIKSNYQDQSLRLAKHFNMSSI